MQVLHGNIACTAVRMFGKHKFSATAYCKARRKLPLAVFEKLLSKMSDVAGKTEKTWHGLRIFIADGTGCSMPDTPELTAHFGRAGCTKEGVGMPIAHMLHLMDFATGMIVKVFVSPWRTSDLKHFPSLIKLMGDNALIIIDKGFYGFATFALSSKNNVEALVCVPQKRLKEYRDGGMSCGDRDVIYITPKKSRIVTDEEWDNLCGDIVLREIIFNLIMPNGKKTKIVLLTTLLDREKYPANDVIELYTQRWEIETAFKHIKQTLKLDIVKGHSVDVVTKEIIVHCIAYNLVRQVMIASAKKQKTEPQRISFIDALRWMLHDGTKKNLNKLIVNPVRYRHCPRIVRRRRKSHTYMTQPRSHYPSHKGKIIIELEPSLAS